MNCPKCGEKLEDGATICPQCKTKMKEKKKRNLIGIASCLVAFIGLFLPYTTVSVFGFKSSAAFIQTNCGFLLLIIEFIVCIFYVLKWNVLAVIAAVIHFVIALIAYLLLVSFNIGAMGSGMYLLILASLVMIFAPLIWKVINKKREQVQE